MTDLTKWKKGDLAYIHTDLGHSTAYSVGDTVRVRYLRQNGRPVGPGDIELHATAYRRLTREEADSTPAGSVLVKVQSRGGKEYGDEFTRSGNSLYYRADYAYALVSLPERVNPAVKAAEEKISQAQKMLEEAQADLKRAKND